MQSNTAVIKAFLNRESARSGSMVSTGDRLFSYNTIIAQWNGVGLIHMTVNDTKYSKTTSKQQTLLNREAMKAPKFFVLSHIENIRINTQSL